jgi:hypothetical protein
VDAKIKVCIDPTCEAVYHNVPVKATRCKECGMRLVAINEMTYWSHFSQYFFQYDWNTDELYRKKRNTKNLLIEYLNR